MARGRRPFSGLYGLMAPAPDRGAFLSGILVRSTFDGSDDGFAAADVHACFHHDLNFPRHQQVCARSEFYHPKTLATFYSLAPLLPTNNAAGQNAGDLGNSVDHLIALDYDAVWFVQIARIFLRGHHKFAFFVSDINDFAGNGRAIDVHVERRQENADQPLRVLTVGRPDQGDPAVRGRHDDARSQRNRASGVTKEEDHEAGNQHQRNRRPPVDQENRHDGEHRGHSHKWNTVTNHWSKNDFDDCRLQVSPEKDLCATTVSRWWIFPWAISPQRHRDRTEFH